MLVCTFLYVAVEELVWTLVGGGYKGREVCTFGGVGYAVLGNWACTFGFSNYGLRMDWRQPKANPCPTMIILWTGHGAAPRVLLYFLICRSIPHIHKHVKQGLRELAESEAGNFRTAVLNLAGTWHDVAAGARTVRVLFPPAAEAAKSD